MHSFRRHFLFGLIFIVGLGFGSRLCAQRAVIAGDASILHGSTNCVTLALEAQGDENALGFSVCFDTNLLTFVGVSRGSGVLGSSLLVNTSRAASGQVGLVLSLSFEEVFMAGSNAVAEICFRAAEGIPSTTTVVRLCDEPIGREIADVNAHQLTAVYSDSTVHIEGICAYALGDDAAIISEEGGVASVSVFADADCPWEVLNTNDWISINGLATGTGAGTVSYLVQPNPDPVSRTGFLEIAGQPFSVTQAEAPCTFQLSPTSRVHDHPSVFDTFDVITFDNCDWQVINTNDWILIKLFTNGTGSGMVRYTVLANLDPHVREGHIVVSGQPFRVIQRAAPCTYNILPASRVVSPSGAAGQITILTPNDCPWSIDNTNLWISLGGPMAGTGNAIINYTVAPRFALQERSGVITIADKQFMVTQLGTPCAYSISPTSRSHSRSRSSSSITVNTNTVEECATLTWTATTTNDWIHITAGSNGIGRGTVRYTVTNHVIGGTRTGAVLVADRIFTIRQSGQPCDFERSPSSRSHSYLAETGFVNVSAFTGCVWTVTSSQPWVMITSDPNGNGNGLITYQLQTNTGSSRSATLRFGGLSFSIRQGAASAPDIDSRPGNQNVIGGANVTFNVTASGTAPLSYQWRFNGTNLVDGPNISGATTSRLILTNVQPHQAGNYTVVVGNVRGSVTSSPATVLRVNTAPIIEPIPPKVVNRGSLLAFKPVVVDLDIPAQSLSYSLLSAPSGASIHSSSGLFTWTPGSSQATGSNFATIRVVDNGSPSLSATQRVTLIVIAAPTTNMTLISTGAVWKYRDTGEDLGTAWTSLMFDDAAWRSGPAALGYGVSSLRTTVGYGPSSSSRYIKTYFRHAFEVADPFGFTSLNLRVRRDDGVVLYLNGSEIYRNNMPSGPIGYRTVASASASSSSSFTTTAADASALVHGINILAAEIHQRSAGSSDIVFDLGLTATRSFIAPSIATHPSSQAAPEGSSTRFSVTANGLPPLSFQWWFEGEPIEGANESALDLSDLQLAQSGPYFVTVTNASGAVTSAIANLTVFKVINTPPVLAPIDDISMPEATRLTFQVVAIDSNLPAQRLTFSLAPGAPEGAQIDPDTGVFSWTPGELDGGGVFPVTVRVADSGSPPLSDFTSFNIMVLDTNNAPVLNPIGSKHVVEETLLTFTASAVDNDVPAQTLSFALGPGAPAGASIDPMSGVFTWTPTETQSPSTNAVTIIVTDDGVPPSSDSETVSIVVSGFNVAPSLAPIPNKTITAGELLSFTAVAGDSDVPAQALRFSLGVGAPAGATINATSGSFNWRSSASDGGTTNAVTVYVTDNGAPPLSNSQAFVIWVMPAPQTNLVLIPSNSVWRFRDTGENLGTAWRELSYNDSAWRSGAGTLGYGGKYIVTTVSYGPSTSSRYPTTYFRRNFSVGNPSALGPLRLRVRRDDGVVVYLNGTEVHRDNMPAGTITYQTLAPVNMDAEDELTYFPAPPIPASLLVPGDNVLAVEVHQKSVGSSDLSFDVELTSSIAALPPVIVAHPQSRSILEGQDASFAVTALGTLPLRHRWYFNGSAIANATNSILEIRGAEPAASGNYFVVVTNSAGSVTSQVATLAVERNRGVAFLAEEIGGNAGQEILVPIRANGFTSIASFQFSLRWDPAVVQWVTNEQFGVPNISFGTTDIANGVLAVSWDEPAGLSRTLPPSALVFALRLRLVGNPGALSSLLITNAPTPIEVADDHLEIVPVSVAHGRITINLPASFEEASHILPVLQIGLVQEGVVLSWNAVPGQRYRLQACQALSDPWGDIGETVATANTASIVDAGPLRRQRIYRVIMLE